MNGLPKEILIVEDNHGDVFLVREAFKSLKAAVRISVVRDGAEVLRYLRREGPHASAPRPDLILLDLNLPRRDGSQVLGDIKSDAGLRQIPVIVFTGSDADEDVNRAYDLHANCYISKPLDFTMLTAIVASIERFWLTLAKLPPRTN